MTASKLCELPRLLVRVAEALDGDARSRPAAGDFALIEHVWHLADLEVEAYQVRLTRIAREDVPWLEDFDGDRAAIDRAYLARPLAAGLRTFRQARAATVRRFAQLRGPAWLRAGIQDQLGYVTLGELPERILAHDRAHALQLAALIAELRPGHPLADELARWAQAIAPPDTSPCNQRGAVRGRAASALPLARVQRAVLAGARSPAALARALGVSARTLQRRLAEHGLTPRCLVDEALRALALSRVRAGADWRATSDALGFAAPRAFARAFKRWTHATPSRFGRAPAVGHRGCA